MKETAKYGIPEITDADSMTSAEARKVMGMTVFSGMLVATLVGVLLVPALYVMVDRYITRSGDPEGASGGLGEDV